MLLHFHGSIRCVTMNNNKILKWKIKRTFIFNNKNSSCYEDDEYTCVTPQPNRFLFYNNLLKSATVYNKA